MAKSTTPCPFCKPGAAALDKVDIAATDIRTTLKTLRLLALNDRIEAARAMEHGAGFGVVAQEMTNLVDQGDQPHGDGARAITGRHRNLEPAILSAVNPIEETQMAAAPSPIDPATRIGHVHLKVADIERALSFYRDVLGFEVTQRYGTQAAFVSAGGYHHHIGLNTWESRGGSPPPRDTTGLYHVAILYPTREALADALRRVLAAGIAIDGASDHGVSEAIYLRDPDGNGIELYRDRLPAEWPRDAGGVLAMTTAPLDLAELAAA